MMILNQTNNFIHVLKYKSIELTQNTLQNMLMSFDIMRSSGLQHGHINVYLCYRPNAICTGRENFVVETYLIVFKNLFSICKLNMTKYLLFNYVLNITFFFNKKIDFIVKGLFCVFVDFFIFK